MNFYKIVRESDQANYDYVSFSSNLTWGRQVFGVCTNVLNGNVRSPGTHVLGTEFVFTAVKCYAKS